MQYLLDTDICIAVMRRHPGVARRMAAAAPRDCVISAITEYELVTGAEKSLNPPLERQKVDLLLSTLTVLPFDEDAAIQAATIRALLEKNGTPIGPYDVLLAGQASANQLIIVTGNTREFSSVPGLQVENWRIPAADRG
jgi:tRNA(fMet)-specific endonuclease VapC